MTPLPIRGLSWQGCVNVRDLGGLPTDDGLTTRYGVVVRGDSVSNLTQAGWRSVLEYGVRTIVDVRRPEERLEAPRIHASVTQVNVPLLLDFERAEWQEISRGMTPPESTRLVYVEFLRRYQGSFASAISAIALADEAVLVHCHRGKDRTGLIVALLLCLAGVSAEAIAADYALSGDNLRQLDDAWVAEAPDQNERVLRTWIAATPAPAMLGVIEELNATWGGAESYLLAAGTSAAQLEHLRRRLRT